LTNELWEKPRSDEGKRREKNAPEGFLDGISPPDPSVWSSPAGKKSKKKSQQGPQTTRTLERERRLIAEGGPPGGLGVWLMGFLPYVSLFLERWTGGQGAKVL
jgi:hypothetical protein